MKCGKGGGGDGGGRGFCGAIVVIMEGAYRLPIFEGGKEGDGSSSLGCARGGGCQRLEKGYHSRIAMPNSQTEWCSALPIGFVGVNVVPFEEYFHHSLVPILSSKRERCLIQVARLFGVDVVPPE